MNTNTVIDAFSLPFTDPILNTVEGHELYSFLDGFNSYNQVRMALEEEEKKTSIIDWGVYVDVVMMFGLKTAPTTFQRIIMEIFEEYIPGFMQVFLDDFAVFGSKGEHLAHLDKCLERCHNSRLHLNALKCAFAVSSGMLLGHIIS